MSHGQLALVERDAPVNFLVEGLDDQFYVSLEQGESTLKARTILRKCLAERMRQVTVAPPFEPCFLSFALCPLNSDLLLFLRISEKEKTVDILRPSVIYGTESGRDTLLEPVGRAGSLQNAVTLLNDDGKLKKGGEKMGKGVRLGCVALFLAVALVMGCASVMPPQKTPLSSANASILKGAWSGIRTSGSYTAATELVILNDKPPFQGRWTLMSVAPPMQEAAGKRGQDTIVSEFKNGVISEQEALYISSGDGNFAELNLFLKEGKPHLEGSFYFYITRGNVSLNKK